LAIILAGCAGASVAPQTETAPASASRPTTVYVYDFAVTPEEVTLNQGFFRKTYENMSGENVEQAPASLADQTAQALSFQLGPSCRRWDSTRLGFPGVRLPQAATFWLLMASSQISIRETNFAELRSDWAWDNPSWMPTRKNTK
jgi:hypothetical protein